MFDFFRWLFDTDPFPPRWHCGSWSDEEGWLHILSDAAIWGAYTAIPIVIGYFVLRRRDVPFPRIFWLFGAFIFACGTTHLLEAIIFWHPIYRIAGLVKLFTAVVSWATIVALVQVTPQALRLPGLAKLHAERERLLDAERVARTAAERASREKDEFLSLVSHELRTPLNAILGYAQLLRRVGPGNGEHRNAAEIIERNGWAQAQIIDDLLDMSRIISGKLRLDVQPLQIGAVIEAAVRTLEPAARAKEINVTVSLGSAEPLVLADAGRMQQIVWNLLANAIKFTPRGGRVNVSAGTVDSELDITVADNGQGIRPEFLPFVFDRFRQQDATTSREHGGLGLGLSIVKHLVELHGGIITASSAGEGLGAAFTVRLPLQGETSESDGFNAVAPTDGMPVEMVLPRLNGVKALVIDDEADSLLIIQRLLEERGADVEVADSADAALHTITVSRPDVLLCDIGMPGMDGYEFMRRLRASGSLGGTIAAAAVTAFARNEDRTRALLAGYQAHVTKPINSRELLAVVGALTGRIPPA